MESKVLFEYQTSPWKGGLQLLIAAIPLSGVAALLLAEWLGAIIGVLVMLASLSLLVYYMLTVEKSSFRIYNDRISFFNPLWPEKEMNVWMKDVFQARYEDADKHIGVKGANRILLYLKEEHTTDSRLKAKKNRIVLFFISQNGAHNIISILKIFQAQGKQVYILTRSKKIKEALGLENWDLSK